MMAQLLPLLVVIALVAIASLWYRRANGVARRELATFPAAALKQMGVSKRGQTLLLFTSPGCSTCAAAKRILDAAAARYGVPVVVADVTEHPEIAAARHVYRAPTTFVIDEQGRALLRISGVPREGEVEHVLATTGGLATPQ